MNKTKCLHGYWAQWSLLWLLVFGQCFLLADVAFAQTNAQRVAQTTDDDDPVAATDDDAPPPSRKLRPKAKPATTQSKRTPVSAKARPAAKPAVSAPKLAPLKAKRGYIMGRAVFANGRSVPRFRVSALGWAGEIHLGPSGTLPSLGQVDATNGRYQFRPTSAYDRKKVLTEALVTVVRAEARLAYKGRQYLLKMHPVDGQRDGDSKGGFRGYVSKGVVRDFVLKMHGPKVGYEKNTPPRDTNSNEMSDPSFSAFYGGTVALTFQPDDGGNPDPGPFKGSVITLNFTPNGTLVDGSPSRPLTRTLRIQQESVVKYFPGYFRDIPLGDYTLTATLTNPNGASYPLRLKKLGSDYQSSFAVQFTPWETLAHVETLNIYATR